MLLLGHAQSHSLKLITRVCDDSVCGVSFHKQQAGETLQFSSDCTNVLERNTLSRAFPTGARITAMYVDDWCVGAVVILAKRLCTICRAASRDTRDVIGLSGSM